MYGLPVVPVSKIWMIGARSIKEGIERQDPAIRAQALNGWLAHPAYVKLARRLSCMLCGICWKQENYRRYFLSFLSFGHFL